MWLSQRICQVLKRKKNPPPFVIWCDPKHVWKDIIQTVAVGEFELWAEEEHELILRQRFYNSPRVPRVVYLPFSKEKITYFKVFEVQAEEVIEISILEALSEYGVQVQSEMLTEIEPLLPAHTKEWLDQPKSKWKELTVGNAKETLVDDELILKVLASARTEFDSLIDSNKYPIFVRRVMEDFGLPEPHEMVKDSWRASSLASLICTEGAELCPETPPHEPGMIIPSGPARKNALNLLRQWKNRIDLIDSFEDLVEKAENMTSLRMWGNELKNIPRPLSSKIVEKGLFEKEILNLNKIESPEELVNYLKNHQQKYKEHSEAFWGKLARRKVPWSFVTELAAIACLLFENVRIENTWKSTRECSILVYFHRLEDRQSGGSAI